MIDHKWNELRRALDLGLADSLQHEDDRTLALEIRKIWGDYLGNDLISIIRKHFLEGKD